nr:MAG TPA: hypothetical protein [Bacteriophage sp.]
MHHDAQQRIGEATQEPVMHGKAKKRICIEMRGYASRCTATASNRTV